MEPEPLAGQSPVMRVLVVDDSERVRKTLATGLRTHGMAVETAADGAEALTMLNGLSFDLVVLDLMMPRVDGTQVLQALKGRAQKPRILVLSARDQVQDRVEALNLGADDYLVKPFQMEELLARLAALLRRSAGWASPVLHCGPIALDTAAQTLTVSGQPVALTAFEYRLLQYLMLHAGEVASKAELTEHLYDEDADRDSNVLEVLVGRLRRKLDPEGTLDPIETLRGRGYRFRCETAAPAPAETPVDV